jgi:hypothetical protein
MYTYTYILGPSQSRANRFECILFTAQSPGSYHPEPIHKPIIVSNPCSAPPFPSPHSLPLKQENTREKSPPYSFPCRERVVKSLGKTPPPSFEEESSILQPHRHPAAHPFPFTLSLSLFLRCSPFSSSLPLRPLITFLIVFTPHTR